MSASVHAGIADPQEQTPPGSRHSQEQTPRQTPPTPGSRHTHTGADTPRADTPLGRHPLGADTPWEQTPPGSRHPLCTVHAGRYGQQVGSTHPTGMHSCSTFNVNKISNDLSISSVVFLHVKFLASPDQLFKAKIDTHTHIHTHNRKHHLLTFKQGNNNGPINRG